MMTKRLLFPHIRLVSKGSTNLPFIKESDINALSLAKEAFIQFVATDYTLDTYKCLSTIDDVILTNKELFDIVEARNTGAISSTIHGISKNMDGVYDEKTFNEFVEKVYDPNMDYFKYLDFYGSIIRSGNLYYLKKLRDLVKENEVMDQEALYKQLLQLKEIKYVNICRMIGTLDDSFGFYIDDMIISLLSLQINK